MLRRLPRAPTASRIIAPAAIAGPDIARLAAGIDRGEITVRFQPIVRLADRKPVMVEALARWERPAGPLGANDFIPAAERAGLAHGLTVAVARAAMAELRHHRSLLLSFNIPLAELLKPGLPAWLKRLAGAAGLAPRNLFLELTESTPVRDSALLGRALERLRRAGFGVLLDDLSLDDGRRVLLDLPFAGVKLDRSLVLAMPGSRRARGQVERVVRQARRHHMLVIAEGVTDSHVWRAVTAAGCDMAQGFGVGRPLLPAALPAWIAAWNAAGILARQPE